MPNDLLIQPSAGFRSADNAPACAKTPVSQPPPRPEPEVNRPPILSPSLRLDPALGLVVIEFRSNSGAVTNSFPSQRQLQAYQRWEATRLGPAPSGRSDRQANEPDADSITE